MSGNRAEGEGEVITHGVCGPLNRWQLLGQCSYDLRQRCCCVLMRQAQETGVRWRPEVVGASPKRSDLARCSPLPGSENLQ